MKPRVTRVIEIPLDQLVIGKGQVRVSEVGEEIDELAESIAKVGLLEPIVVCEVKETGKYEILTGQRRFLAHKQLGREKILAGVVEGEVDETAAKVISITENLVRRELNRRDLINACTALFKKFGSVKDVCAETGLPESKVREYVKYDRLPVELKKLVDDEGVDLKVALKALDAASVGGGYQKDEALKLAKEMAGLTGAMQARLVQKRIENPDRPVDEVIEEAKTGEKTLQMRVSLGAREKAALDRYAREEGTKSDEAARDLITESLQSKGYLSNS